MSDLFEWEALGTFGLGLKSGNDSLHILEGDFVLAARHAL
jgi:hypothetical protein